jgi:hypothetical protein
MSIRNYAGISTAINIILIGLLVWTFFDDGRGKSAALDRETLLKGNAHLKSELALRDSVVLAIQNDRATDSVEHAVKQKLLSGQIRGLKRQLLENPGSLVIRDTIILKQDTLIIDLENERDSLKISFKEELRVLGQSRLALEQAYDSTFNQLLTVNDALIVTERKLSKMEKVARFFGISAGTLAVIVAVLAIAL